jgi:hypothetical protein
MQAAVQTDRMSLQGVPRGGRGANLDGLGLRVNRPRRVIFFVRISAFLPKTDRSNKHLLQHRTGLVDATQCPNECRFSPTNVQLSVKNVDFCNALRSVYEIVTTLER